MQQVPPSTFKTLDDFDSALFEDDQLQEYSSATYRIDAIRLFHKVCIIQRIQNEQGRVEPQIVDNADLHLTNWKLHVPDSKNTCVDKHGNVDEMLFEAQMVVYA